jgi:hypothetical protein
MKNEYISLYGKENYTIPIQLVCGGVAGLFGQTSKHKKEGCE